MIVVRVVITIVVWVFLRVVVTVMVWLVMVV